MCCKMPMMEAIINTAFNCVFHRCKCTLHLAYITCADTTPLWVRGMGLTAANLVSQLLCLSEVRGKEEEKWENNKSKGGKPISCCQSSCRRESYS